MPKPTAFLLTLVTILSRLVPHPANFTTLGATSLFAGGKLPRPWNYLAPLAALALTDLIIGLHTTMPFVYASIAFSVWLGERFLRKNPAVARTATVALASSTVFFLVTNFGVWLTTAMYPKTPFGLLESYVMGLPFWRNMLAADLLFSVGFFALYAYANRKGVINKIDKRLGYYLGLKT